MGSWMDENLAVQGYCLNGRESRALRTGLRLPTALCLAIVAAGLVLQSAAVILAVVPVGIVTGWTKRHRRRHGTAGATAPALVLGWTLIGVCSLVTVTNYCIPSTLLAIWHRRRGDPTPA